MKIYCADIDEDEVLVFWESIYPKDASTRLDLEEFYTFREAQSCCRAKLLERIAKTQEDLSKINKITAATCPHY